MINEDHYTSGIVPNFKHSFLHTLGIRLLYPLADAIISPTQAAKDDLVNTYHLPEKKITIIPNWSSLAGTKSKLHEKVYDLIYVGRLAKTKKIDFLIEGVKKIELSGTKIKLAIVGDGEERERLEKLVLKMNLGKCVYFLGARYDTAELIGSSRVFVYTSQIKAEGFPIAILEAMSLGIPVVTRRFAGAEDVLRDGENGFLFDSADEFTSKLLKLLTDKKLASKMGDQAQKEAAKKYSLKNIKSYLKALGY